MKMRQSPQGKGLFTVQYPDEKLQVPERFRYLPFLLYEEVDGKQEDRCTSCGICAKVCPPQCIWIERTNDPVTKRPVPQPKEFYIDTDICMNCGYCAEYCPFDAIKMDHIYELASYDRTSAHVYNKEKLSKPVSYYAAIRPTDYTIEEKIRAEEEAKKAAKKAAAPAAPAAGAATKAGPGAATKAGPGAAAATKAAPGAAATTKAAPAATTKAAVTKAAPAATTKAAPAAATEADSTVKIKVDPPEGPVPTKPGPAPDVPASERRTDDAPPAAPEEKKDAE
jgi:NADH-quinone oxidoreductase subunit I